MIKQRVIVIVDNTVFIGKAGQGSINKLLSTVPRWEHAWGGIGDEVAGGRKSSVGNSST